jgi:hypothetical protein
VTHREQKNGKVRFDMILVNIYFFSLDEPYERKTGVRKGLSLMMGLEEVIWENGGAISFPSFHKGGPQLPALDIRLYKYLLRIVVFFSFMAGLSPPQGQYLGLIEYGGSPGVSAIS